MKLFRRNDTPTTETRAQPLEARLAEVEPGVPGRCPTCDGLGYIDILDVARGIQVQHCRVCLRRWEYAFDAHGHVVQFSELDEGGRPVLVMRIADEPQASVPRTAADPRVYRELVDRAASAPAAPTEARPALDPREEPPPAVAPEPSNERFGLLTRRPEEAPERDEPAESRPGVGGPPDAPREGQMTAAEWLRHTVTH